MATAQCGCGKRIGVSDALIGKTVKCPECGEKVVVTGAAQTAKITPATSAEHRIHISGGFTTTAVLLALFGGGAFLLKTGPIRVSNQWDAMNSKASGDVTDVVSFALQAYLSQAQLYNPTKSNHRPAVDGPVTFEMPWMVMKMPDKVHFVGMTDQGSFEGFYHPSTGQIDAQISYGGAEVGGLLVTRSAAGSFHITGRDVDGNPQAESDGSSLKIYYPPPEAP